MYAARDVHVGAPKSDFSIKDNVNVHFHDFANLSLDKTIHAMSPIFTCAGYDWVLILYPGGTEVSKNGMMGVCLFNLSMSVLDEGYDLVMGYDISIKKRNGSTYLVMTEEEGSTSSFFSDTGNDNRFKGFHDFANRGNVLDPSKDILNNGTLTLNVCIRPHKDYYCHPIKPQLSLGVNLYRKLFRDKESVDLGIVVGGKVFHAHKLILKVQAPDFAELSDQFDMDTHMVIEDVERETFELMLRHVYGKMILANEWKECSKQILQASGKYGFTALKLEAEAWYVKFLKLTVDNAVDELLYADAKDCPHLKNTAMKFIVANGNEIIASTSYDMLDESPHLRREVMHEFAKSNEKGKRKGEV